MELEASLSLKEIQAALSKYLEEEKGYSVIDAATIRFFSSDGHRQFPHRAKVMVSNDLRKGDDF